MITVGILVSYLVAVVVLVALPNNAGNLDWRLILGIGALPAIVAVALRSRMPESPRWLSRPRPARRLSSRGHYPGRVRCRSGIVRRAAEIAGTTHKRAFDPASSA